jgi:hypothetical protein
MSNIFYSEVDPNLQLELNLRGNSGKTRTTEDINFMVGKLANVQLTAFEDNKPDPTKIVREYGILGGANVRTGRYLPATFLSKQDYTTTVINFTDATNIGVTNAVRALAGQSSLTPGQAFSQKNALVDESYRIGPYITSVDVTIGDHSMGLLNKATVNLSIPNPERDLDGIEDTWFRPGRYVKIEIVQPDSAVLSKSLLSTTSIPIKSKLKELYPNWDIDKLETQIRKMNEYSFEGVITSFEFSYQSNGQVDATISLTGTSNVYTDVSMWMQTPTKTDDSKKPKIDTNPVLGVVSIPTTAPASGTANATSSIVTKNEFYDKLYNQVDSLINEARYLDGFELVSSGIVQFKTAKTTKTVSTDQFILFGEPYNPLTVNTSNNVSSVAAPQPSSQAVSKFSRYITLGALVQFINDEVVSKITGSAQAAQVICDTEFSCCNYYPLLTSCIPNEVLLLPENTNQSSMSGPSIQSMNSYGPTLTYYKYVTENYTQNTDRLAKWPGVHTNSDAADTNKIFGSRIFINLETIQKILNGEDGKSGLTAGGSKGFSLKQFMAVISSKLGYATGGSISMKLVTHPLDETKLLFNDTKYLKTPLLGEPGKPTIVTPYSIPMFANHPNGTVVRDFKMSATLPENAKNLSYVLNEGDEVTEEEIAPYMNMMYNSKDPDSLNKAMAKYKQKHTEIYSQLIKTIDSYGESPEIPEKSQALWKALSSYIKYPTNDIKKSQQITAPIFPFSVEFTIDGINGFRYGDVLQFVSLPKKYRENTVFSIISITHTIGTDGAWTSAIRCIMRPSIN